MKNLLINGARLAVMGFIGYSIFAFSDSTNTDKKSSYSDYKTERSYSDYGDKDCSDFPTQSVAQGFFETEGGPSEDYHDLDRDRDGVACETLP